MEMEVIDHQPVRRVVHLLPVKSGNADRNGSTCQNQYMTKFVCQCRKSYKGKWCDVVQVKVERAQGLSSGSIEAITTCLFLFLGN